MKTYRVDSISRLKSKLFSGVSVKYFRIPENWPVSIAHETIPQNGKNIPYIVHKKTEEFEFPVKDISKDIVKSGFACPGSLLKINLKTNHPITYGLPEQIGVFHREGPVFTTWQPFFDVDRRVIATFPEKDILLSGYSENEEKIGNKSSIVWLKKGKGQVVLLSFSPQFRASTPGTYKLLFNSILLPDL